MKSAGLVALLLVALTAASSEARADGWYVTEGFGASELTGEATDYFEGGDFAARLSFGRRVHNWSIEGNLMGTGLEGRRVFAGNSYSVMTVGLDAKYHVPIGTSGLGVYLRGGLNKTHVNTSWGSDDELDASDYEGRGITYGAGVQLSGKVPVVGFLFWPLFFTDLGPKVTAALWLDTSRQFVRLHHEEGPSLDGKFSTWTLGFAVGSDF